MDIKYTKKILILAATAVMLVILTVAAEIGLSVPASVQVGPAGDEEASRYYEITAKRDLLALLMAYPDNIKGIDRDKDGVVCLFMSSGCRVVYDDMKKKSYEQKLASADLQDSMEILYPLDEIESLESGNFDPGRIRAYDFLKEIYGDSRSEVEASLKVFRLVEGSALFNVNAGASGALDKVFSEVTELICNKSGIKGFIYPVGGTYNYRTIAGTNRLSAHAFGIAIDLSSGAGDYWRWATREQGQKRLDSYPREIVRAFENNGFIWGGKWAHFDILHFEYRPELIIKSKYYNNQAAADQWNKGFPENEQTEEFIKIIDNAFI